MERKSKEILGPRETGLAQTRRNAAAGILPLTALFRAEHGFRCKIGKKLLLKPVDDSYSDVGVVIVCLMEILLTIRPLNG